MKLFLVLSAVVLAVAALPVDPVDLGEDGVDDADSLSDIVYNIANFTDARVPAGQIGFATLNGGTFGGQGGATWTVWDPWALRDAVAGNDRRIVIVRGRIDLLQLFTSSPGVRLTVGSTKTIRGQDRNALVTGGGFRINGVRNVIVENLRIFNALSLAPGERPNGSGGIVSQVAGEFSEVDNIEISTSTNVWINHCEFADDPWNAASLAANRRRHDGLIDIKRAANWITVSNSILRNHNHVGLIGHADNNAGQDNGRLKVTYALNWFRGTNQRNPRVRFGEVHVLNNLYTDITSYGVGVGAGARIYSERNCFINSRRAWGFAAGVPNPAGGYFNDNNRLVNSGFDANIPSNLVTWRPANSYRYTALNQNNVEAHVRSRAGPR